LAQVGPNIIIFLLTSAGFHVQIPSALNLSDVTSEFRTVAMFILIDR